jgi:sorting nexin-9/18/33
LQITSRFGFVAATAKALVSPQGTNGRSKTASPLESQLTGTDLPNFRRSLLGGRSLNRFTSFVTSGAEDWVLKGCQTHTAESSGTSTAEEFSHGSNTLKGQKRGFNRVDRHFIDSGPSWRSKVPPFRVLVHSPYKHIPALSSSYTLYQVTSIFTSKYPTDSQVDTSDVRRVTVHRRFSHFVSLHTVLSRELPGIALPPLPGKQYAGRFNDVFVEARRRGLELYLSRLIRHPVVRYASMLMRFLSCENDVVSQSHLSHFADS